MKARIAVVVAIVLGGITFAVDALAGAKEDAVLSGCALTASTYAGYAACVAAGLTGNEIGVCLSTPDQCFGPNNELRKMFCAVGVGCPPPPSRTPQQLVYPLMAGASQSGRVTYIGTQTVKISAAAPVR
jgi:hypothetical protein